GIVVHAQRSDGVSGDWTVLQTAGQDWADLNNYRAGATAFPRVTDEGRFAREQNYAGRSDARHTLAWSWPTFVKFGGKIEEDYHQYENRTPWYTWNYTRPGGGPGGSWGAFPSPLAFMMGDDVHFLSLSG